MAIHTITQNIHTLHHILDGTNDYMAAQRNPTYQVGDVVHAVELLTGGDVWFFITALKNYALSGVKVSLRLTDPTQVYQQYSMTNQDGKTSVFWVGTDFTLLVGDTLVFDAPEERWSVNSCWTTLYLKDLPKQARVVVVTEIF